MRRLVLVLALLATCALPAQAAKPRLVVTARAEWFPATRMLYLSTSWTPARYETQVQLVVIANGDRIRTLRAQRWLVGHKTFELALPSSLAAGSELALKLRVSSRAGTVSKSVPLVLT